MSIEVLSEVGEESGRVVAVGAFKLPCVQHFAPFVQPRQLNFFGCFQKLVNLTSVEGFHEWSHPTSKDCAEKVLLVQDLQKPVDFKRVLHSSYFVLEKGKGEGGACIVGKSCQNFGVKPLFRQQLPFFSSLNLTVQCACMFLFLPVATNCVVNYPTISRPPFAG